MSDQQIETEMVTKKVLNLLSRKGIHFSIETVAPYGGTGFSVSPEQIMLYLADEDAALAACWKVTKEQYRDCRDEDFMQHCSAETKKGRRCRNLVAGTNQLTPLEWVRAQGGYCELHGGETGRRS